MSTQSSESTRGVTITRTPPLVTGDARATVKWHVNTGNYSFIEVEISDNPIGEENSDQLMDRLTAIARDGATANANVFVNTF